MRTHAPHSYADWRRSGYTPSDVFSNVRALKSTAAWKDLCAGLQDLEVEDLATFEPAIREYRGNRKLRCAGALEARLTAYWASRSASLSRISGELPGFPESLVGPRPPLSLHRPERTTAGVAVGPPLSSTTLAYGTEPARRQIVLSFEQSTAPQSDRAARILDSLDQFGARAVFFLTGESARANPALLRLIAERQHQLGSLGWDEKDLENIPVRDSENALAKAQAEVAVASGAPVLLFRNPLGFVSWRLRRQWYSELGRRLRDPESANALGSGRFRPGRLEDFRPGEAVSECGRHAR